MQGGQRPPISNGAPLPVSKFDPGTEQRTLHPGANQKTTAVSVRVRFWRRLPGRCWGGVLDTTWSQSPPPEHPDRSRTDSLSTRSSVQNTQDTGEEERPCVSDGRPVLVHRTPDRNRTLRKLLLSTRRSECRAVSRPPRQQHFRRLLQQPHLHLPAHRDDR